MGTRICSMCKIDCKVMIDARGDIPTVIDNFSDYRAHICRLCRQKPEITEAAALLSKRYREAKDRCTRPGVDAYKTHGGRGIKFELELGEFLSRFMNRTMTMLSLGQAPSLNRINNDGNYSFDNIEIIDWSIHRLESYDILSKKFLGQRRATHKICTGPCKRDLFVENFSPKRKCVDNSMYRYPNCNDCRKALAQEKGQGGRTPSPGYFAKYTTMKGWENPGWDIELKRDLNG